MPDAAEKPDTDREPSHPHRRDPGDDHQQRDRRHTDSEQIDFCESHGHSVKKAVYCASASVMARTLARPATPLGCIARHRSSWSNDAVARATSPRANAVRARSTSEV